MARDSVGHQPSGHPAASKDAHARSLLQVPLEQIALALTAEYRSDARYSYESPSRESRLPHAVRRR